MAIEDDKSYELTGGQVKSLAAKIKDNASKIEDVESGKQDKLTAGENITIEGNTISATGGGSGVDVVQDTGTSTSSVMSQKAVTDRAQAIEDSIYRNADHTHIAIGNGATTSSTATSNYIAIGPSASASAASSIVLGPGSSASATGGVVLGANASIGSSGHGYSVAVGYKSTTAGSYEVSFGGTDMKRKLTNVSDGTADHHAVTLGQMNTALEDKQDTLTAGDGIAIASGVISINKISEAEWDSLWNGSQRNDEEIDVDDEDIPL